MTHKLTGWETTRLSKHFILLDFLADHAVYKFGMPLVFEDIWNPEHDALAKGLCTKLLEPLMTAYGPISVAYAFWPSDIPSGHAGGAKARGKHRWTDGEATVDVALYKEVDKGVEGRGLLRAVKNLSTIDGFRDRVLSYPKTEFACVTFKSEGAKTCGDHGSSKWQNLRAHHVRVGRFFNMLDFCRNGRAVEEGINLVPEKLENKTPDYQPITEETAARSFAAALDPLVDELGRISVIRGMETAEYASDEHAKLHCWNQPGPWRLVFVLPQGEDPDRACDILKGSAHVQDVQTSPHPSDSHALALILDQKDYDTHRGLRPVYSS